MPNALQRACGWSGPHAADWEEAAELLRAKDAPELCAEADATGTVAWCADADATGTVTWCTARLLAAAVARAPDGPEPLAVRGRSVL